MTVEVLGADDPRLAPRVELAEARALVRSFTPSDDQQRAIQARLLAFVDAHPDALARSCVDGHLTGSALVVDHRAERVLFLLHRKAGRWLQPGGHADGDANLAAVARREAEEETGIAGLAVVVPAVDLDIHQVAFVGEVPHLHLDVRFVVLAPEGAQVHGNHESDALRWVTVDQLDQLDLDAGTHRLVAAGLHRARQLR